MEVGGEGDYIPIATLYRDSENGGKGVWRWGEREIVYLSLHCHHQYGSCIKMRSDESHFNVSLIVRDKATRVSMNRPHRLRVLWKANTAELTLRGQATLTRGHA